MNSSHDDVGNLVLEGTTRHMEWDHADQLRAFYNQGGSSEPTEFAHYLYDSEGRRVKKVVRKSSGNTEVTVYIDGGFEHIYELNGGTRDEEMNGIHVMDGRSRIARLKVFGSTWSGGTADAVLYNIEDHLGNACFTLESGGALHSREEYFPFGETAFGSHAKKRHRFCGKERDEESGLYYYGARYYAAWACRFVGVDPLAGEYAAWSPYCYALDNPVVMNDPDGMAPEEGGGGGGKDGGQVHERPDGDGAGSQAEGGTANAGAIADQDMGRRSVERDASSVSMPSHGAWAKDRDGVAPTITIEATGVAPAYKKEWSRGRLLGDGLTMYHTAERNGIQYEVYDQSNSMDQDRVFYRRSGSNDPLVQFYPKGYDFNKELQETIRDHQAMLDLSAFLIETGVPLMVPGGAAGRGGAMSARAFRFARGVFRPAGRSGAKGVANVFKSFTARNYRHNLQVLTGESGVGMDAHHIYPQARRFQSYFQRAGINIHDPRNMKWWESDAHRRAAGGYNKAWDQFFFRNPSATLEQIQNFGSSLMKTYGF